MSIMNLLVSIKLSQGRLRGLDPLTNVAFHFISNLFGHENQTALVWLRKRTYERRMLRSISSVFQNNASIVGQIPPLPDSRLNQIQLGVVASLLDRLLEARQDNIAHFDGQMVNAKRLVEIFTRQQSACITCQASVRVACPRR